MNQPHDHTRLLYALVVTCAAVALMLASAAAFRTAPGWGLAWAVLGGVTLSAAITRTQPAVSRLTPATHPVQVPPLRWLPLVAGLGTLGALAEINARMPPAVHYHMQLALFVGGIALVVGGFGGRLPLSAWRTALHDPHQRREIMLVGLITACALALRLWRLGAAIHVMVDSLHFVEGITHLWDNSATRILLPINDIAAFTHLYPVLQNGAVSVWGPDLLAIRIPSAVLGALSVTALYALARALFDRPTAVIAALLLAAFPPHLHFSRLALNNIADPTFGVIALALLAHGLRTNRTSSYVWAGAAFGLTHYFYEGGRLLFWGLGIAWIGIVILAWRPWSHRAGLVRMTLVAVIVALPVNYALARSGHSPIARFQSQSIDLYLSDALRDPSPDAGQTYWDRHLRPALLHHVSTPDGSRFYYRHDTPLLLWYMVPLFLLGLVWALRRGGMAGGLVLLWVAFNALGNSLLVTPDWTVRYVAVFPALALLAALGLRHTWDLIARLAPGPEHARSGRLVHRLAPVLIALALAAAQAGYYFGPHLDAFNHDFSRYVRDFYDPLYRAARYPPTARIIYIGDDPVHWPVITITERFWDRPLDVELSRPFRLTPAAIDSLPGDRVLLFFLEPDDAESLALLRAHFSLEGPIWSEYDSVPRANQYVLYVAAPS